MNIQAGLLNGSLEGHQVTMEHVLILEKKNKYLA